MGLDRRKNVSNSLEVAFESRDSVISNPYQTLLLDRPAVNRNISPRGNTAAHLQQRHTCPLFAFFLFISVVYENKVPGSVWENSAGLKSAERYLIEKHQHVVAYPNRVSAMCSGIQSDLGLNLAFV